MQQQQVKHPWRAITYRIAKWAWIVTAWIWTTLLIAFLAQYVPIILTTKNQPQESNLDHTWTATIIHMLQAPEDPIQDALKWIILIMVVLLIAVPPFAFGLQQMLHDVEPKGGIEKLIDVLQYDTISPQLELLQQQLEQQCHKLEACAQVVGGIFGLLQQTPTASHLRLLYTVSQQHYALQKEQLQRLEACVQALGSLSGLLQQTPTSSDVQGWQKEISQMLQDIQKSTLEQVQWSGDLYEQDQHHQEKLSADLAKLSLLLEQMQKTLNILALPSYQESRLSSHRQALLEPIPTVIAPTSTDERGQSVSEYAMLHEKNM